jgi:hypothetical protein
MRSLFERLGRWRLALKEALRCSVRVESYCTSFQSDLSMPLKPALSVGFNGLWSVSVHVAYLKGSVY